MTVQLERSLLPNDYSEKTGNFQAGGEGRPIPGLGAVLPVEIEYTSHGQRYVTHPRSVVEDLHVTSDHLPDTANPYALTSEDLLSPKGPTEDLRLTWRVNPQEVAAARRGGLGAVLRDTARELPVIKPRRNTTQEQPDNIFERAPRQQPMAHNPQPYHGRHYRS